MNSTKKILRKGCLGKVTTMPNIKDPIPGDDKLKVLIFAPYKTGKSWGAGTWPRPNFFDFDGHISMFKGPEYIKQHGLRDIQYGQFYEKSLDSKGVPKAHNAFDDACRYFDECMKPGKRDSFDTWVIDSGTTASELAANKAMILLGTGKVGQGSNTWKQAQETGLVIPKKQDYGAERSMIEQFVQMVKDTDKHLVFICHDKHIQTDEGIVTDIVPLLTGKSAQSIPLKFNEVWYLKIKKEGTVTKRVLQTHADSKLRCGTFLGIPDGTEWEWEAIQKAIKAAGGVASAPAQLTKV